MAPDISEGLGSEGNRVFISSDYDAYMERLRPYREKVFKQGVPLSDEDVAYLAGLEAELVRVYTRQSIADSGISGKVGLITGRDDLLKDIIWRTQLQDEHRALSRKLGDAALSPEEEAAIYARLAEICENLEPEHCSRSLFP